VYTASGDFPYQAKRETMAPRIIRLRLDRITKERTEKTPNFLVTIRPRVIEAPKNMVTIRTNEPI
jgi:hypothetical protein